jgi:hypothetical protein
MPRYACSGSDSLAEQEHGRTIPLAVLGSEAGANWCAPHLGPRSSGSLGFDAAAFVSKTEPMTAAEDKSPYTECIMHESSAFPGFPMASDARAYPIM